MKSFLAELSESDLSSISYPAWLGLKEDEVMLMKAAIADPKMYKQMRNRESGAGRQAGKAEGSLEFGSYKDAGNRHSIDLGKLTHKTHREADIGQQWSPGTQQHFRGV